MAKGPRTTGQAAEADDAESTAIRFCGIVRPIAEMGNYTAKHWREVHNVIAEAVEPLGFTLRLVSESDAAGVILTEIVSNLYQDEIVIVDVSGRNPNVMFELGMRLAFEKPAIIIMDDETSFSFDISPVKHIRYPKTLRYSDIVKFKIDIATAITATLDASPEKRSYLQQFGPIKVTELNSQSIELNSVAQDVQEMKRLFNSFINRSDYLFGDEVWSRHSNLYTHGTNLSSQLEVEVPEALRDEFLRHIVGFPAVSSVEEISNGIRIFIDAKSATEASDARNSARALARQLRHDGKLSF